MPPPDVPLNVYAFLGILIALVIGAAVVIVKEVIKKRRARKSVLEGPRLLRGKTKVLGPFPPEPSRFHGGLIVERSPCCGASIITEGGLRIEICAKCKKPIPPPAVYRD